VKFTDVDDTSSRFLDLFSRLEDFAQPMIFSKPLISLASRLRRAK
jgi:hypothetical protein